MRITRFSGLTPANSPRHGTGGGAVIAINTRTTDGSLRAIRRPKKISDCTKNLILGDTGDYVCGDMCSISTNSSCGAGRILVADGRLVNAADNTPIIPTAPPKPVIRSATSTGEVLTAFRVANISSIGAVSPPSPVTDIVNIDYGQVVRLGTTGNVRVYALLPATLDGRVPENGEPAAQWAVVGDFAGPASFEFAPETWDISDDTPADEQCAPVGVLCLTRDELGHYYAWSKSEVWISDRNSPEVWPTRGHITLEHNIVHAIAVYDMLLVLTDGKPFVVRPNPNNEGALNPIAIPYSAHHAVFGGREVVSAAPLGVVYASQMGLIALTGQAPNGYQLLTRNTINPEEWRSSWRPAALGEHHGTVVTDRWVFDLPDTQHGTNQLNAFHTHDFSVARIQSLPDGRLIVFTEDGAYEWAAGDYAAATYESNEIVEQGKRVHTAGKVVGRNIEGVRFQLIDSDTGEIVHTQVLSERDNNVPFRIRACRGQHYRINFTLPAGEKEVIIYEVHVAPDINDLTRAEGTTN
jgi:hypothetical protein